MQDLKQRAMRGGLAKIVAQITTLLLRTGSLMVMARLLTPADFGLVGMVTAMIGIFSVFRDFGLSAAAVQRASITSEQSSTLFWINLLVGVTLALTAVAFSPLVARFYHQQQLIPLTAVLATAFVFNAAGVQHQALLERQMRFVTLSVIDIISLAASIAVGISMAFRGFGFWALVATSTVAPLVYTASVWIAARWIPGRPRRRTGIRSLMRFGGTLTLNGLVMYFAMNLDKVLMGRYWGASSLGIYGRGYQLVNIPTDNLNSAAGGVVFAALSRVQHEPHRLRNYFLKGYSLLLSLTVPITCICALFGTGIIYVFLGPKWHSAAPVFRLLAPTTFGFALLAPLGWLLSSCGLVARGLKMALVFAPVLIAGYASGLPWGPTGVALAYSSTMMVTIVPLIAWAVYGTPVHFRDLLHVIGRPLLSGIAASAVAFLLDRLYGPFLPPWLRLGVGVALLSTVYLLLLLYVMRQKQLYVEIVRSFMKKSPVEETAPAPI